MESGLTSNLRGMVSLISFFSSSGAGDRSGEDAESVGDPEGVSASSVWSIFAMGVDSAESDCDDVSSFDPAAPNKLLTLPDNPVSISNSLSTDNH